MGEVEGVQQLISTLLLAASLIFFAYQTWRATCGWEEVYVTIIECEFAGAAQPQQICTAEQTRCAL